MDEWATIFVQCLYRELIIIIVQSFRNNILAASLRSSLDKHDLIEDKIFIVFFCQEKV